MRDIDVQPSEIRRRVLEQHKTIRERVAALEELALAVGSGRAEHGDLPRAIEGVRSLLGTHMRFEDDVLPTPGARHESNASTRTIFNSRRSSRTCSMWSPNGAT